MEVDRPGRVWSGLERVSRGACLLVGDRTMIVFVECDGSFFQNETDGQASKDVQESSVQVWTTSFEKLLGDTEGLKAFTVSIIIC